MSEKKLYTISKGELTKVNVEGCKSCAKMVYLPALNATKIGRLPGWYELTSLQQREPGEDGRDVVVRVRGRVWGALTGKRICPNCAKKN